MLSMSLRRLLIIAVALSLISSPSIAGWEIEDESELMESTLRLREVAGSPDGMGGMLLGAVDEGGSPDRIVVSRVDHTGTEVWGDNGFWLPLIVGNVVNIWPTAVTHDGQGGGYFAYHASADGNEYLRVAHVNSAGTYQWSVPIDNLGTTGSVTDPAVQLVPTDSGNVIIIFKRFTSGPILYSACVDDTGAILWHGPIHDSWGYSSYALAKTDGLGGAFIAYWRNDTTDEVRVQRLNGTDGARVWGTDGALVWSGPVGGVLDIVSDYAGGGYLVRSDVGITYAQHVNSSGIKTWGSDLAVHDTQTIYFAVNPLPKLCTDGSGGFIMYHGIEDMFAQRMDINGSLLWGGGVTVATSVDHPSYRSLSPDGFGGAVMTYENSYLISGSTYCDQTKGARVDSFGTVVWDEFLGFCDYTNGGSGPDMHEAPHTPMAFGDGSGGGIFAWVVDDVDGSGNRWIWGKGVDAQGGQPLPRVTFLYPDAAEPGGSGPYLILGNYLDLSLGYTLEKEDESTSLALTPTDLISYQMVGGTTTLTGLTPGPYHLKIEDGGTEVHTFEYATGLGHPIPCSADEPIVPGDRDMRLEGSQRQAVYTDDGRLHAMWIEYDSNIPQYALSWWTYDGSWTENPSPYMTLSAISEVTVARDGLNRLHVLFVLNISPTRDQLIYLRLNTEGAVDLFHQYDAFEVIRNPVAGITDDGVLHVVMERGASPGNDLLHLEHDGISFSAGVNPTTNGSPRNPDLAVVHNELELVWSSNSAIPGIQQMERARFVTGAWDAPAVLSFGLGIRSPSVAHDGGERILFAWIIDNELLNGIRPLVHKQLLTGDTFGPLRQRPGLAEHFSVSVAAAAPGGFVMLTSEGDGGPDIVVTLREGDGRVFFPRIHANTDLDVWNPRLAAHFNEPGIAAYWSGYDSPDNPVPGLGCSRVMTSAPAPDVLVIDGRLRGRPNPFNPSTEFQFELARASYVVLEVFDMRGRLVRPLFRGELDRGPQAIPWNGRDDQGAQVSSGAYLARLKRSDGSESVSKVALLK